MRRCSNGRGHSMASVDSGPDDSPLQSLWRHPDFLKLWAGQTVSSFGSEVTRVAVPLVAVLTLNATAAEVGVLRALQNAPFLLFGLLAGVWVDRLRRRPVLIAADLGRALVLASLPLAWAFGSLGIWQLYAVVFAAGVLTLFFDVAYLAYLPALVGREHLLEANAKLQASYSVAHTAGPAIAGAIVGLLAAPVAVALDAASFLVSALAVGRIRRSEPPPEPSPQGGVRSEVAEGLRVVLGDRLLRPIAACTGSHNFFEGMRDAVFVLFVVREFGLAPEMLGLILAAGGVGGLLGALFSGVISHRLGLGGTMCGTALLIGVPQLVVPFAVGPSKVIVPMLAVAVAVTACAATVYGIATRVVRGTTIPGHLLGRASASFRLLVWGPIPAGAMLGGFLGTELGLRPTLLVGALGVALSSLWIILSPVRGLWQPPGPTDDRPRMPA